MRRAAATAIAVVSAALAAAAALPAGAFAHSGPATIAAFAPAPTGATISGRLTTRGSRQGLQGMLVQAVPASQTGCTATSAAVSCGPTTYSGPGGAYSLTGLDPGTYTLTVLDGSATLPVAAVTIGPATTTRSVSLKLPVPSVPDGTAARGAGGDLRLLNAERARDGLPADVVLNPRWSTECAAHDAYEAANDTLTPSEDPASPGSSPGGAWAGLDSVLAQGRWTGAGSPWEDAPVHLLALLAPSLSVTGIDDTGSLQCAITFPGMLRAPVRADTITTVPDGGADNVPTSETARESPFTPVQFAGLPTDRPTGRELFVYLNRAGDTGQAPVTIVRASLSRGGQPVPVRWVDTTTRTLGQYLAGGIVIPVDPLRAQTTYRATVAVRNGARTLTRSWGFTTR
jgi:hypothetical protein